MSTSVQLQSRNNRREGNDPRSPQPMSGFRKCGQVAQVVERSPEKAGVGGSTPSLATTFSITYLVFLTYYIAQRVTLSWVEKDLKLDPPPDGAQIEGLKFAQPLASCVRRQSG